jgi:hypothetical protein
MAVSGGALLFARAFLVMSPLRQITPSTQTGQWFVLDLFIIYITYGEVFDDLALLAQW